MKLNAFLCTLVFFHTMSAAPNPKEAEYHKQRRDVVDVSNSSLPGTDRKHFELPEIVKTWKPSAYGNFKPTIASNTKAAAHARAISSTSSTIKASPTGMSSVTSSPKSSATSKTSTATSTTTKFLPYGPQNRGSWLPGFDINTDVFQKWPETGRTVYASFFVQNTTLSPDGIPQHMLVVNGQYPGPLLEANWGDWIEVTVYNQLQHNATGIHWHGFRHLNTNTEDGAAGVTECPIAPGKSKTYRFQATQYGTSWYHSHFSRQYGAGVMGPILIKGPSSANWDVDLGTITVNDWYDQTVWQKGWYADRQGPPIASNYLLNGRNFKPNGSGGRPATWVFQKGKKHLMRFINTGVNNQFKLRLDGHTFTVVQTDFVPIVPYKTKEISINIGQRYEVIVEADQPVANYYLRALNLQQCGNIENDGTGTANGIVSYLGAPARTPVAESVYLEDSTCQDEPVASLVPVVKRSVNPAGFKEKFRPLPIQLGGATLATGENVFLWYINGIAQSIDWTLPTVETIAMNNTIASSTNVSQYFPNAYNMITLPREGEWTFLVIQNEHYVPHPIHLHGHDFSLLGQGDGFFDSDYLFDQLNFVNPPRRDVATLVSGGWTVIAFQVDNPGSWLLHCHILWHNTEGLSLQFIELPSKFPSVYGQKVKSTAFQNNCQSFDRYFGSAQDVYSKANIQIN